MSALTASRCSTLMFAVVVVFVSADQKNITAESGQDVTLTCRAPNNNIIIVEWSRADLDPEFVLVYRDGHFLTDDQHPSFKNRVDLQDTQMKDGDASLVLSNVTINDAGTYECRVFMNETGSWMNISFVYLVVPPGQTGGHTEDASARLIVGLSVSAVLLVVVALLINLICKKYERGFSTRKQKQRRKRKKTIERAVKYSKLNKAEPDVP